MRQEGRAEERRRQWERCGQGLAPILQCQGWSGGALLMVRTVAEEQALLVGTGAWLRAGQGSALHIQPWAL